MQNVAQRPKSGDSANCDDQPYASVKHTARTTRNSRRDYYNNQHSCSRWEQLWWRLDFALLAASLLLPWWPGICSLPVHEQ